MDYPAFIMPFVLYVFLYKTVLGYRVRAAGNMLQNTSIKTQLTATIPYLATIIGLVAFSVMNRRRELKRKSRKQGL